MKTNLSLPIFQTDFVLDRARLFMRAPQKIYFGHCASAIALIYLAADVLPIVYLVLWFVWEVIVIPLLLNKLSKGGNQLTENSVRVWLSNLHLLFLMIGISWGAFVFFGLDIDNPAHFSMQIAIVAGASAAACRSLGIFKFSFYYYEVPFAGLLAIKLFLLGGDYIYLGGLVVIFIFMMCGLASDVSDELSDYLATKSENLELAKKFERAAHEADRANREKSQFLAQANHDLRQPIHAIGLLAATLRSEKLSKEGSQSLDTIMSSVNTLSEMFGSLLSISALESGKIHPGYSDFAIQDVMDVIVRQAMPEAAERNVELRMVRTSAWVHSDRTLVGSILQNLVFNAIKYAPGSKVLIGARVCGNELSVHVLDQGSGITDAARARIFDEFSRGDFDQTSRVGGLGLGLAIVKRTADLLSLDIEFASDRGKGTHVAIHGFERVSNGRAESDDEVGGRQDEHSQAVSSDLKILVVDDQENVLTAMEKLLHKWNIPVDALLPKYMSDQGKFDILIIDFHLNESYNGIELAKKLIAEKGRPIPTCIVSGTIDEQLRTEADSAGFHLLHKPVSPLQLRSTILTLNQEFYELNSAGK